MIGVCTSVESRSRQSKTAEENIFCTVQRLESNREWREEQIIRKEESTVTTEKVTTKTKKAFEQKTANYILVFVQNLDDFEEADISKTLYIKAVNKNLESNKENYINRRRCGKKNNCRNIRAICIWRGSL